MSDLDDGKCPVCDGPTKRASYCDEGRLYESDEVCTAGCFEYHFAYGTTEYRVGDLSWQYFYDSPDDHHLEIARVIKEMRKKMPLLTWVDDQTSTAKTATLGSTGDGVTFWLSYRPTCYRRGPYCLLIEVCGGENHYKWGCFDEADQPQRYFHKEENAKSEAEEIARVLLADRHKV